MQHEKDDIDECNQIEYNKEYEESEEEANIYAGMYNDLGEIY